MQCQESRTRLERRLTTEKGVGNWVDDLDLACDIIDGVNTERIEMEVHAKGHSVNDQVSSFFSTL